MAVTTTLFLTRYGQAQCNLAGLVGGEKTCTGLTGLGRRQVQLLAARLRDEHEPGLSGPHHGDADGQPWTDIKTAFGGPPQTDPDRPYVHGSETWNQYLARAAAALAELISRHPGQSILIAGHGETVEAAATLLLGLPAGTCTRAGFQVSHASLTRWHLQRNRFGQDI